MTAVLVTGFEPFGGEAINPSMQVLDRLEGWRPLDGMRVHTRVLRCMFGGALQDLDDALQRFRPSVVIALGLAASRDEVSVERVAINVDDARIADNAGVQPIDQPVHADGPAAYFSTLPVKRIVAALREQGLPAAVSQSAGTFVCNHVFYGLMHRLALQPEVRAGFVHLPALPEQASLLRGRAGLSLDDQVRAAQCIVLASLSAGADLREGGGAVD